MAGRRLRPSAGLRARPTARQTHGRACRGRGPRIDSARSSGSTRPGSPDRRPRRGRRSRAGGPSGKAREGTGRHRSIGRPIGEPQGGDPRSRPRASHETSPESRTSSHKCKVPPAHCNCCHCKSTPRPPQIPRQQGTRVHNAHGGWTCGVRTSKATSQVLRESR